MAIQAEKLSSAFEKRGWIIHRVAVNQKIDAHLAWINRIPVARTMLRTFLFLKALNLALKRCRTIYLLSGFFDYFFWVSAPAILLTKARNKRIYLSARGGAAGKFFDRHGWLIRPIIRLLDGVTAPSPFLRDEFKRSFATDATIIPNIADLNQFRFQVRPAIRPRLLCARNLEPIYNVACSIQAFAAVKSRYPDAIMGIAGDGSEKTKLQALCHELGVSEAVTFMGQVLHAQMPEIYRDYDILINSSNEDNLPGVILEAFASGLPVVSTRAGGIPYLVEHETTGLLVEKKNAQALAAAAIRLIDNPSLAAIIASNAHKICAGYSADKAVSDLCLLFSRKLERETHSS
jgi:glycosyltransferase involved in cell wall biosynthesis